MSNSPTPPLLKRLIERVFPPTVDFYELINEQCRLVENGTAALVDFMKTNNAESANKVKELEHQGDQLKLHHLDKLHRAFSTQMDREDIYRAFAAIDDILNYAKTTVKEMQVLGLKPDEHTLAMAQLMNEGMHALTQGFAKLKKQPLAAEADAIKAHKTERTTEKIYRKALAELFDPSHYVQTLTDAQRLDAAALTVLIASENKSVQDQAIASSVGFVLEILKRREVYRHMSNGADRIAFASEVLHDMIAKNA
ncbi:MAG: DUF47 family protein [Moraxellaceae bacterium]|nr:DUF47 family protein [Moraxellaceae bacterium]HQV81269.1 DUF47 family protein [Agitococcus sp.]